MKTTKTEQTNTKDEPDANKKPVQKFPEQGCDAGWGDDPIKDGKQIEKLFIRGW